MTRFIAQPDHVGARLPSLAASAEAGIVASVVKLFDLLRSESAVSPRTFFVIAGIAGISNAAILAIVNAAATQAASAQYSTRFMLMFVIVILLYYRGQRHVMVTATTEVEKILDRLRVRLAGKIRRCELYPLEGLGRTVIYSSINKETTSISQSALALAIGGQFAILVLFTAFYVAYLSRPAFVLTTIITILLATIYLRYREKFNSELHQATETENKLFDSLTHLLEGFKDVRMNRRRSDDLFGRFEEISHSASRLKTRTQTQISTTFIASQLSFYLLLGVIVFIVPRLSFIGSEQVVKTTTAVLFLIGPISGLVTAVPALATANVACENIARLESALDTAMMTVEAAPAPLQSFKTIAFHDVIFTYDDSDSGTTFTVGPLDFTLDAGEVVFVAGGNGSGKSTFLKLLTSLYHPQGGTITVDGRPLAPERYEAYRSLFSVVFTDYHLFDRLYGLYDVPQEEIDRMLELFEISSKIKVANYTFDSIELSGGQRKRLAVVVSLLENRPICIFDEVAADQDPAFRRKFYQEIVPMLKAQKKTVVAVTHDDKYFDAADRLLKMDEGLFVRQTASAPALQA